MSEAPCCKDGVFHFLGSTYKKDYNPLMVEHLITGADSDNEEENKVRRSSKKWIIFSIAIFIMLTVGAVLVFAWPYKGWLQAQISCGGRPVLGVETKANGSFGTNGKVAIVPDDPGYDRNITAYKFFYTKDVYYFCDERAAAERGFVTRAAFDKAHPAPSYAMETPTYKAQELLDRGYVLEDENIGYGYGEWDESIKYPYYEAEYRKTISPERVDLYELTQYKIIGAGSDCSTNLFLPYGDVVTPGIDNTPWQACHQVGVLSRGAQLYRGTVAGYEYNVYFANINGTLVALTRASFPDIVDVLQLFNSLAEYSPTTAGHNPIYRRDRPMEAPF